MDLNTLSQEDLKQLRKQINSKITKAPKQSKATIAMLLEQLGPGQPDLKAVLQKVCRSESYGKQMERVDEEGKPLNVRYTLLPLLEFFQRQRSKKYAKTVTSRDGHTSTFLQVIYTASTDASYGRSYVVLLSDAQVIYGPSCYTIQTPGEWVEWPEPETLNLEEGIQLPAQSFNDRYNPALQVFSDGFITALETLPTKPTQRVLQAMMARQQDGSDNPQHALNKAVTESSEIILKDLGDTAARAIFRGIDPPVYPSLGEWVDVCIEIATHKSSDVNSRYGPYRAEYRRTTGHDNVTTISTGELGFPLLARLLATTNLIAADFGTGVPYEGIFSTDMGDIIRGGAEEQRTIIARASVLEKAVAMKLGFTYSSMGWLKVSSALNTKRIQQGDASDQVALEKIYSRGLNKAGTTGFPQLLKSWSPCVMVTHEATCFVNGSYRCVVDATSDPLPKGDQTARRMLMFASTYRDAIYTLANDKKMLEDLFVDVPYETIRECREIVMQETGGPKAAPLDVVQLN
jgi:hypothetical protein